MTAAAKRWAACCLLACVFAAATAGTACAGALDIRAPSGNFSLPVTSLKAARYARTIRQQYDFSCGSAAVATLLTHQFGQPVTEDEVFARMYARSDQRKVRSEGFSLLDMRRYFASRGFLADGFALPLDKLLEERVPAIVLINQQGYRHFVVVKGLRGDRVLIGDPAAGTRAIRRAQFDRMWDNQVLFVVHNRRELARFNDDNDWRSVPGGPLEDAVQRGDLRQIVMPKRGPGDI